MKIPWWRWLFHRHKTEPGCVSRGMAAYLSTTRRREAAFDQDMEDDPAMCEPQMGRPTARITRLIYQDETLMDWEETRTMETIVL